jgi:hypothetical protein
LDWIAEGDCLGNLPMRTEFEKNKLIIGDVRVGEHADAAGGRHAAFGMFGEV